MGQPAAEPQRRCVGCGRTAAKRELIRLVAADDGLAVLDPAGHRPGRGAYLCRRAPSAPAAPSPEVDPACVERATRRGALGRALRRPVRMLPGLLDPAGPAARIDGDRPCDPNLLESMG